MEESNEMQEALEFAQGINNMEKQRFESVPFNERILFLSHCIRAPLKKEIQNFAENLGYRVHVVGGGSIVHKIIKRENPKAVVGIACHPELEMAVDKLKMPLQVVLLDTDGCKDTTFNMDRAKEVLSVYTPVS